MKLRNLILGVVVGLVLVAGLVGPAKPASAATLSVTLEVFPNPMPGLMEGANIVATVKSSGNPIADADLTISIPNPGNYVNDAMYLRIPGGEWWERASSVSGKTDVNGQFSVFGDIGFCPSNLMQVGLSCTASKAGYGSGSATCTWVIDEGLLSVTLEVFPNPMPGDMEGANIVATVKYSGTPVADTDVTISIPNPGNYQNDAMYLRVPGGEWWNRASSVSGKTDVNGQFSVFGDIGVCPSGQMQIGLSCTASKAGYTSGSATCTWVIDPSFTPPQPGEPADFEYTTRYRSGSDDEDNDNETWCGLKCPHIQDQTGGNPVYVKSGDTVWFEIQIGRHADLSYPFSLPAFKNATDWGQSATSCILMSLPNGDVVGEFLPDEATIECLHATGFMELGWVRLGSIVSLAELIGAMQVLPDMVGMVGPDWWDFCMFVADRVPDVMDAVADISYGDAHGPDPGGECFNANNCDVNIESVLYGVQNFAVGGFRIRLPIKFTGCGQGKLNFHSTYAYTTDSQWVLNTAKVQFPEIFVNVAGPPEANAGPDQIVEQTSAAGTQVMLDGSASKGGGVIYQWYEGNTYLGYGDQIHVTFPPGTHYVTLKVTAAGGAGESDTDEVVITVVQDTTPPNVVINVPGGGFSITYEADSPDGFKVDHYDVELVVTDACDPNPTVVFQPPEGTTFPLGATGLVQVFATDDSGNVGEGLFGITVVDTTPPVITTSDQWPEYEANVPGGAIVESFEVAVVSVTDICDPNPTVTFEPPPGYTFLAGATCLIQVFATDSWGNVGEGYWGITVVDTTPPDITAPADITQSTDPGKCYATVELGEPTVSDICDVNPDVTNDAPEVFPLGTTTVKWTAEDYLWNVATDTQIVTVVDNEVPWFTGTIGDVAIGAGDTVTIWATAEDNISVVSAEISIDSGALISMTWDAGNSRWGYDYTAPSGGGEQTYSITVYDAAGNYASSGQYSIISNCPPVAVNDTATTDEDTSITIDVLANDSDSDEDSLTVAEVTQGTNGSVKINDDDTVTYTPDDDYNGVDSFTYKANDGQDDSNTANVTVTVNPVNDAPSFTPGGNQTVDEDSGKQSVMWATMISPGPTNESSQEVYFIVTNNSSTLFSIQPAIAADGMLTFTPAQDANGSANVTVQLHDDGGTASGGQNTSPVQSFTITVRPVNDQPELTLTPPGPYTVNEGDTLTIDVTASDPDNDPLTFNNNLPIGSSFIDNGDGTGTFSWTPGYADAGTYDAHFEVTDGDLTDSEDITITVLNVNREPILDPIGNREVDEETLLQFNISGTDPDVDTDPGHTLSYSMDSLIAGASFDPITRQFTWTPDEEQGPGIYYVTFTVIDNGVPTLSDSEAITITVNEVNQPPVLSLSPAPDYDVMTDTYSYTIDEEVPFIIAVSATDPDIPANSLTIITSGLPAGASFNYDPLLDEYTLEWIPSESQGPGQYTVTFTADDGAGGSDSETVTITVNEVNQAPVLDLIGNKVVDEETTLTLIITASDPDTGPGAANSLSYSLSSLDLGADFDPLTQTFTWTPTEAEDGIYTATFIVTDNGLPGLSDSETITITVNEVNKAPTLTVPSSPQMIKEGGDFNETTGEYEALTFTLTASDPDIPANALTFSSENLPPGATLDPITGEFVWMPDYNAYEDAAASDGIYIVTFVVSDGELTDSDDITIEVENEPFGATESVTGGTGGTVSNTGETDVDGDGTADPTVEIDIPADALPSGESTITIEPHSEYALGEEYGSYIEQVQYDFQSTVDFIQSIEIRFYFGHIDPDVYGGLYTTLTIMIWDESLDPADWNDIRNVPGATTDGEIYYDHADPAIETNPYIYFYTDHFSVYAVVLLPLDKISGYIQDLSDNAFDKNAKQRKKALENKLDAVKNQVEAGAYQGAVNKLLNDIRAKMDGEGQDWIIDSEAQTQLCVMIDNIVEHLEYLEAQG